ncbi:elongator complex protein 4-like [Bidens hawaiensis]|uniref:elongator complex protein 4-like n=1 Tax=Bidens hawaiensis TaxID=980011 RepID=UPI004048FC81
MPQGLIHNQPVLYASPSKSPRAFLGTLPATLVSKDDKSHKSDAEQDLRIAWQYKRYLGENKPLVEEQEYCNDFDLRKPIEKHLIAGNRVECVSLLDCSSLAGIRDSCSKFLSQLPRYDGDITSAGRIAIQSFCASQCEY